jgi:hypothetical protein
MRSALITSAIAGSMPPLLIMFSCAAAIPRLSRTLTSPACFWSAATVSGSEEVCTTTMPSGTFGSRESSGTVELGFLA